MLEGLDSPQGCGQQRSRGSETSRLRAGADFTRLVHPTKCKEVQGCLRSAAGLPGSLPWISGRLMLLPLLAAWLSGRLARLSAGGSTAQQTEGKLHLVDNSDLIRPIRQAQERVNMTVNGSVILMTEQNIPRVQVDNPELLTITPLSARQVQIHAKKTGIDQSHAVGRGQSRLHGGRQHLWRHARTDRAAEVGIPRRRDHGAADRGRRACWAGSSIGPTTSTASSQWRRTTIPR